MNPALLFKYLDVFQVEANHWPLTMSRAEIDPWQSSLVSQAVDRPDAGAPALGKLFSVE